MKQIKIMIDIKGNIETATIEFDRREPTLTLEMKNGFKKSYSAYDLYICFGMLRADHPEIKFLCKGSKLNVHPSRMSSQMSKGLVAYELKIGKPSEDEDLVRIFDYEDEHITNDIEEQKKFYKKWLESLARK
ncbi:hypothetical protein [Pseudomonas sp. G(2018)]|uniref:hypothetical protein n=1 Tax=Pseudomonas sp. G(2018) TaxID=2502242 RepID=UPI0010F48896|nr:hypothetical protein [Pseudomonas sp. G(2018)]